MPQTYSRRSFLTGAITSSALTAVTIYLMPDGRAKKSAQLTLWSGADATGGRKLLFDMWDEANPNVTLNLQTYSGGTGDQKRAMYDAAKSGDADIVNLDIIDIPAFAKEELIEPLKLDEGPFLDGILTPGAVDGSAGSFWAAPFNTDVGVLLERVPAGGAATDRPDLSRVLGTLVPPKSLGFAGQVGRGSSASNEAFTVNLLEHVMAADPDFIRPETDFTNQRIPFYEAAKWQEALAPLRAAIADGKVIAADSEATSVEDFLRRPGPRFMRNWPIAYRDLRANNDTDAREGKIRMHAFPTAVLGGQSLAVVRRSPRKAEARQLIDFLTSDKAQTILAQRGLPSTKVAAYNDPELQNQIPHLETIRQAVESARMRPVRPGYAGFTKAVATHIRPILAGSDSVPSAFIDEIRAALS